MKTLTKYLQVLSGTGLIIAASCLIIAGVALVIFWPLVIIWALNTIFALSIPYTFWTWLSSLVLLASFGRTSVKTEKND